MGSLEPYSVSKILRYLLKYNNEVDAQTEEIYKSMALQLIQTINDRAVAL
jgi:hypothetical protein